jgi:hypothetical protein
VHLGNIVPRQQVTGRQLRKIKHKTDFMSADVLYKKRLK